MSVTLLPCFLWDQWARSYRTLRDGSFGLRSPRHFVPGYDRAFPRDLTEPFAELEGLIGIWKACPLWAFRGPGRGGRNRNLLRTPKTTPIAPSLDLRINSRLCSLLNG